ncbi:MAG: export transporter permease LptG [Pseudomonadota bacterium]|jgi:lipopolysaccharide export system permease protein
MRTVRRLLYAEILGASVFVMLAFLGLFFFIDFVAELEQLGKGGALWQVFAACLLQMPGHIYELAPIALLIGAIYALARLAQSSEFTILRTGGLGPRRALWLLALLGLGFAVFTFVVGDWVAPWSERQASLIKASRREGGLTVDPNGAWLRASQIDPQGRERRYTVNIGKAHSDGELERVRIYEFGPKGELVERRVARSATILPDGSWQLDDVGVTRWTAAPPTAASGPDRPPVARPAAADSVQLAPDSHVDRMIWPGGLKREVVAAAVLPLSTMSTYALYTYMSHLSEHEQAAQRYEIQFWRKALYPFACLVMLGLALPFAYMHGRSGGVNVKVFGGILLGISFVLLNNVSGHLGLLRSWTPWIAAGAPSVVYLLLSFAAFSWLVRYR